MDLDVQKMIASGQVRRYKASQILCRQGESGRELFFLIAGKAALIRSVNNRLEFSECQPGQIFGENTVLGGDNEAYTDTVLATEDCIVLCLGEPEFYKLLKQEPGFAMRIIKSLKGKADLLQSDMDLLSLMNPAKNQVTQTQKIIPAEEAEQIAEKVVAVLKPADELRHIEIAPHEYTTYIIDTNEFKDKMYYKELTCPVCRKPVDANIVRTSKLIPVKNEPDFRTRYSNFEPLWFNIQVCPHCYYANYQHQFVKITKEQIARMEKDTPIRRENFHPELGSKRSLQGILDSYYLTMHCADIMHMPHAFVANIWLQLGWIYDDLQNHDKYIEAMNKAHQYYNMAYMEDEEGDNVKRLQKMAYLLGTLNFKLGDYKAAYSFFAQAIKEKEGNKMITQMARDQRLECRKYIAEEKSTAIYAKN